MDFMTILGYAVSIVETAALLGALVFITRAAKTGKNAPEKKPQIQKAVICIVAYLILNSVRVFVLGA